MTLSQISVRLTRSISELFRMMQVLEARGYLTPAVTGDGFEITNKLFSLGMNSGATQNLLSCALPLMKALSDKTFQACHLVVASGDQMVVIARMEAPGNLSFSVRVGFRRDLVGSTSGAILCAFIAEPVQTKLFNTLRPSVTPEEWITFEERVGSAYTQGYLLSESSYAEGVIDISCPVFSGTEVVAALAMPLIRTKRSADVEDSLSALRSTTRRLSTALSI